MPDRKGHGIKRHTVSPVSANSLALRSLVGTHRRGVRVPRPSKLRRTPRRGVPTALRASPCIIEIWP